MDECLKKDFNESKKWKLNTFDLIKNIFFEYKSDEQILFGNRCSL